MLRFYLRLIFIPVLIFTLVLILIRARPYDDHGLRKLLLPEGCPSPCFMGIRPGVTTGEEAIRILKMSGWVTQVTQDLNVISWTWNGKQPHYLAHDVPSRFYIPLTESIGPNINAPIFGLNLPTTLNYWQLYLLLGGTNYRAYPKPRKYDRQIDFSTLPYDTLISQYSLQNILAIVPVGCSPDLYTFWNTPIKIQYIEIVPVPLQIPKQLCPFTN